VNKVIIYGSRVKGNYKQGSDIDLTVVGDSLDLQDILKLMVEMDDLFLPYEVDLSDLSKIDNVELIDHIQRVGKLFYVKSIEKES
jgi:predicted nucleotidyltransferase